VVHILKSGDWQDFIENFFHVVLLEAREEGTFVIDTLYKSVDGITVSFD
jgi:hypothetical protein